MSRSSLPEARPKIDTTWGRRKKSVILTLQGELTEKQYEKVERAMLKIADRYNLGYGDLVEER